MDNIFSVTRHGDEMFIEIVDDGGLSVMEVGPIVIYEASSGQLTASQLEDCLNRAVSGFILNDGDTLSLLEAELASCGMSLAIH